MTFWKSSRPRRSNSASRLHRCGFNHSLGCIAAVTIVAASLVFPLRGSATEGEWSATNLIVSNDSTGQVLTCQILLAHWFETTLGPIAPGSQTNQPLAVRSSTGDIAIVNSVGDHMAVERISCGPAGPDRTGWVDPSIDPLRLGDSTMTLGCRLTEMQADCQFD